MSRRGRVQKRDNFEEIIDEYKQVDSDKLVLEPPSTDLLKVLSALLVCVLPVYLFASPMYEVPVLDYIGIFVGVTICTAALVAQANARLCAWQQKKLWNYREEEIRTNSEAAQRRRGSKVPKPERKAWQEHTTKVSEEVFNITRAEAISYSLFLNNFVYLLLFCLMTNSIASGFLGELFDGNTEEELMKGKLINYVSSTMLPALLIYAGITQL